MVQKNQRTNTRGLRTHLKLGAGKSKTREENAISGIGAHSDRPQPLDACEVST